GGGACESNAGAGRGVAAPPGEVPSGQPPPPPPEVSDTWPPSSILSVEVAAPETTSNPLLKKPSPPQKPPPPGSFPDHVLPPSIDLRRAPVCELARQRVPSLGSPLAAYTTVTPARAYARNSPRPFEVLVDVVVKVWVKVGAPDMALVER